MYHLIIEQLGVKRCIATSETDSFEENIYLDCSRDNGCIPENFVRELKITCAGNTAQSLKARVYSDD